MITLSAPYDAPVYSVVIRNPELADGIQLDTGTRFWKAMDGTTYGYKKTTSLKTHHLVFKELTRRKLLEIIKFLSDSSGYFIKYIDYNGHIWRGVMTNNPNDAITYARGKGYYDAERKESCEITLEFRGKKTS